ncbi:DUF4202 family protein [Candidatus Parcubacteria bacterium]|nr:DUF4202 family protein [Candidatus Parcubacteria bacterium]
MKYLIINADDFGYSKLFNKKILELIEKDFVSSTSVMVESINDDQNEQVLKLIELTKNHNVSVGLHVDFKSTDFDEEIKRQYDVFVDLFGFKPVHIDIHKSTYLQDGYPRIIEFSKENKIPCKNLGVEPFTEFMTKDIIFDGTNLDFSEIEKWFTTLKDGEYYTAIFHPGIYDPDSKSSFNEIREVDAKNIVKLNKIFDKHDVKLISYSDFIKKEEALKSIFNKTREFVKESFNRNDAQMRHFDRTAYWIKELKPDVDIAYLIAAIGHDIERAFKDAKKDFVNTKLSFRDEEFLKQHSEKGAEILGKFLEKEGANNKLINRVKHMVSKHELGGDEDQNLLKDADSLSFVENNGPIFLSKIEKLGYDRIKEKFDWMYNRITSEKAKEIGKPFYDKMMSELEKLK